MPKGGKRPGAGRPKGAKSLAKRQSEAIDAAIVTVVQAHAVAEVAAIVQDTAIALIDAAAARQAVRALILPHVEPLVAAQIANGSGIKYLVTRHKKTGKFIRVTEAMARHKEQTAESDETEETIEVWEKDPNVHAFTELMNRLLDLPGRPLQKVELSGKVTLEALVASSMSERP